MKLGTAQMDQKSELIEDIRQELAAAAWRMKLDPQKQAVRKKKVYPARGQGRFLGTSMYMWPLYEAMRPLWIGYDGQLYYYHADQDVFLPANYEKRDVRGLWRLRRLIRNM